MFGFQRRGVRRCENDTLLPKPGPLPHTSQTEATGSLQLGKGVRQVAGRHAAMPVVEGYPKNRLRREPGPLTAQRPILTGVAVLADPLRLVIGDKAAKRLASALDLHTVGDLLGYYPRRYDKRGELTDLVGLTEGEYVTVQAEVASVSSRPMRNRRGSICEAVVTDGRGRLTLTFFGHGRQDWREKELAPGTRG